MPFIIKGVEYTPTPFPKLTYADEKKINSLLQLQQTSETQATLGVSDPEVLLKLLLTDKDGNHPAVIDELRYEQILEIIASFFAEREEFLSNMGEHLKSLVEQKRTPTANTAISIN